MYSRGFEVTFLPPIEYRVKFIRGRSQRMIDSMLPLFADAVIGACPTNSQNLTDNLVFHLEKFMPDNEEKTLRNYATEIITKLFGMVIQTSAGQSVPSDLTEKLIIDSDQPAFFKVLATRLQFPNPMNRRRQDYEENLSDGVSIRPLVLVLETLRELNGPATYLEIRTFILANLRAYRGELTPLEISEQIIAARKGNVILPDPGNPNRAFHHQHITEMLKLLKLANLILEPHPNEYRLNVNEVDALAWIFTTSSTSGQFRTLTSAEDYQEFQKEWSRYYGSIPDGIEPERLNTPADALNIDPTDYLNLEKYHGAQGNADTGKIGENIVLKWQKEIVQNSRPQDLKHVKDRSAERGIGFDIQSIWTAQHLNGQFRYIEVKTTKRSTPPDMNLDQLDLVNLTANEYKAAVTHSENFTVCRVYLYPGGFEIYCLDNPVELDKQGDLILQPSAWHLYIKNSAFKDPAHIGERSNDD